MKSPMAALKEEQKKQQLEAHKSVKELNALLEKKVPMEEVLKLAHGVAEEVVTQVRVAARIWPK